MLDLSIFHVASGHANEITQTQGNQSIKKRPEGYRDMMLFICISIENALEVYLITLLNVALVNLDTIVVKVSVSLHCNVTETICANMCLLNL